MEADVRKSLDLSYQANPMKIEDASISPADVITSNVRTRLWSGLPTHPGKILKRRTAIGYITKISTMPRLRHMRVSSLMRRRQNRIVQARSRPSRTKVVTSEFTGPAPVEAGTGSWTVGGARPPKAP